MNTRSRIERLEREHRGVHECDYVARVARVRDEELLPCVLCGETLMLVYVPPKLTRDEWIARAADFAVR